MFFLFYSEMFYFVVESSATFKKFFHSLVAGAYRRTIYVLLLCQAHNQPQFLGQGNFGTNNKFGCNLR